jgi:hypothetical protein
MKKQIIIHTDDATHAWLKQEAQRERRTLGNQVLALLLGARMTPARPPGNRRSPLEKARDTNQPQPQPRLRR